MDTTPPRFERFLRHMPATSDPTLITLKGHLIAEEILDDIIRLKCRDPEALSGVELSFFVKSRLARALVGAAHENGIVFPSRLWPMVDALNELRNDLAHKLESTKLAGRMNKFISLTVASSPAGEHDQDLPANLSAAISFVLGYLSCFEIMIRTGEIPPEFASEA